MLDADGNRILWGWIPETRPDAELIAAGWAGVMSLPRVLSLNAQNELQMEVTPVARQLRATLTAINPEQNPSLRQKTLDSLRIHDLAAELKLELVPKADKISIHLQSETGQHFATIACADKSGKRELRVNAVMAPLPGAVGSPIGLRFFLDGSVLEIFANQTTSLTARIYQIPSGPLRLKIDGDAEVTNLDVWQMKPISTDRLTGSLCT
jgi:beta-fructofuranosidase